MRSRFKLRNNEKINMDMTVRKIIRFSERLVKSETLITGGLAIFVGLSSGVGIWLFKWLIEIIKGWTFGSVSDMLAPAGKWPILLIPALGGALVGLIAPAALGDEKLHGTASIIQATALSGGRLRYQTMPLKSLAAALSIGVGASVGPEDPSVQIGANFGSMFSQWLRVSDERARSLVAAGSASAIAAAFNAPIAGVFFSLEIILGEMGANSLGAILIAAVASSVFTQAVSGASPAFRVPQYAFHSAWELPLYLLLGALAGPVSALYVKLLYAAQDFFAGLTLPRWAKTAAAGLLVGATGIFLPQIFGVGYEAIGEILNRSEFGIGLLFALMIAKLIFTPVSIAGGFLGGVFAPSLFIGATLGGGFGLLAARFFPALEINPAAFALVGMAAVLAGAVHAPLTATLLLFEMTGDYRIILPLMLSVAVSLLVSRRIQKDSVYSLGLARHGVRLERGREVEVLQTALVSEAMQPDTTALLESTPLDEAAEIFIQTRRHGLPVVNEHGELSGILTLQDIQRAEKQTFVGEACQRRLETAFPDETLSDALRRMSRRDLGRLPVVARENPKQLLGVLRRSDIIRAYEMALARRAAQRHREHKIRLDALTPARVNVVEATVTADSPCAGKLLSEIPFPRECVIASTRRGGRVFVPRGETELQTGDTLVIVAEGAALQTALQLIAGKAKQNTL